MKAAISRAYISEYGAKREVRRNVKALRSLRGIWKGKEMPEPVAWQRRMRRDVLR